MIPSKIKHLGFFLLLCAQTTLAAPRIWNIKNSDPVQADFISEQSGIITLKTTSKKTLRISLSSLSDSDITYLRKTFPLKMQVTFSKTKIRQNNGQFFSQNNLNIYNKAIITQTSKVSFNDDFYISYFIIGKYARKNQFLVMDHLSKKTKISQTRPVTLISSYHTSPDDALLSEVKQFGYLLLITNKNGDIISIQSDRKHFIEQYKKIIKTNKGNRLDQKFTVLNI